MTCFWQLLTSSIFTIGVLDISAYFYDGLKSFVWILTAFLKPYFQSQMPQSLSEKFGKWAVITGATDGIGKEYSKELAKQGINVVLISDTKEQLVSLAQEIETEYKVKSKWIVADFSKGREIYAHIEKELTDIPVGILVNNVSKTYDYPDEFSTIPEDTLCDIININVGAVTVLSRLLIPHMKREQKGAIVNISSGSELQATPYMAIDSATKRYIKGLTMAMERELFEFNIKVQCLTPLFMPTKMYQCSKIIRFLMPSTQSYARSAVFTLGKTSQTTGYWTYSVKYFAIKLIPEWMRIRFSHILTRHLRKQYLAQQGKLDLKKN